MLRPKLEKMLVKKKFREMTEFILVIGLKCAPSETRYSVLKGMW
jgi:hypothetical protein